MDSIIEVIFLQNVQGTVLVFSSINIITKAVSANLIIIPLQISQILLLSASLETVLKCQKTSLSLVLRCFLLFPSRSVISFLSLSELQLFNSLRASELISHILIFLSHCLLVFICPVGLSASLQIYFNCDHSASQPIY